MPVQNVKMSQGKLGFVEVERAVDAAEDGAHQVARKGIATRLWRKSRSIQNFELDFANLLESKDELIK